MGLFNKIQTIKMDYGQLAVLFDKTILNPDYKSLWNDLLKTLNKHYVGKVVDTPDGKYTFYMSYTAIYTWPYTKKYIWIRDNDQKIVYQLNKPRKYKEFKKLAITAIVNKSIENQ